MSSIGSGTRLGPYEVQDFIGQGAMGVVYRAYHSGLERTGAVKVMQAITPDADSVARFRHEAQAIARLRHPNIVDVYDFGEFQGTPYMIVEYVPGGSLAAKMAHGPLDQATALRYLRGIAAGLDYAHSHGVVHRDIKPANVLLTDDDSPVLADFGLAKLMQGSSLRSMTGVTTGTPAYMAPEQVTGGQVGPAADRYSLASIAYEMLTGVIPFDGEALMELLYAQVHRYPSAPSVRDQSLGPQVDAVVMRGLSKNPGDRWESCTAFVDALSAALRNEPVPAAAGPTMVAAPPVSGTRPIAAADALGKPAPRRQPATVAMAFPAPVAEVVPAPAVAPVLAPQPRPRRRRRLLLGIAAILVLVLVLGVCAIVAQATTLSLSPSRVSPGDSVTVTATHVPANQAGEIQLWSVVRAYPFQASANGDVTRDIVVPLDIQLGNHVVKICWDNTCHKQAPLQVVAGVAEVQPTPAAVSTPSPSASPTSSPIVPPKASPTPTSNPCPRNTNNPTLTPATQSVLVSGGNASVSGSNFTPNSTVTLSYYAPAGSGTAYRTWRVTAACNGTFPTQTFATRPTLTPRTDRLWACDVVKGCWSATINIVL